MNKYFLDANFFLDISTEDRPRHSAAVACLNELINSECALCTSSDILTTIAHFMQKKQGIERCLEVIDMIANEIEIVCAGNQDILKLNQILHVSGQNNDYEDALQLYLADKSGCTHLITSDAKFCQHLRDNFTTAIIGIEARLQ